MRKGTNVPSLPRLKIPPSSPTLAIKNEPSGRRAKPFGIKTAGISPVFAI